MISKLTMHLQAALLLVTLLVSSAGAQELHGKYLNADTAVAGGTSSPTVVFGCPGVDANSKPAVVTCPATQSTQDAGTLPNGVTQPTGGVGLTGLLGGIYSKLLGSLAVTGTFWQATQPVSLASVPLPAGAATAANQITQSTPSEVTTTVGTTSTTFGTAGSYHSVMLQAQGQPMCVTFGTGTPTAPSTTGVCAVGFYLAAGQGFTYTAGVPSSQGKAAALAAGGSLWESVQ